MFRKVLKYYAYASAIMFLGGFAVGLVIALRQI